MYIYKYIIVNVISFRINWAITDRGGECGLGIFKGTVCRNSTWYFQAQQGLF